MRSAAACKREPGAGRAVVEGALRSTAPAAVLACCDAAAAAAADGAVRQQLALAAAGGARSGRRLCQEAASLLPAATCLPARAARAKQPANRPTHLHQPGALLRVSRHAQQLQRVAAAAATSCSRCHGQQPSVQACRQHSAECGVFRQPHAAAQPLLVATHVVRSDLLHCREACTAACTAASWCSSCSQLASVCGGQQANTADALSRPAEAAKRSGSRAAAAVAARADADAA